MNNIGKSSLVFENIYIKETATVVGPKEHNGPYGEFFDKYYNDLFAGGEQSFEKAEMKMFNDALQIVMKKAKISENCINCIFSGDLNNQIIIGNYVLRNYDIPYIGIFGACSTSILGIITGCLYLNGIKGKDAALNTSNKISNC